MKKTIKIVAMLLAILFSLSVVACGTYNGPANGTGTGNGTGNGGGGGTTDPTPDEEGVFSDTAFTVSLRYQGELYIPEDKIDVYWTNTDGKGAIFISPIYSNGVAGVEGLDGDFRVTLSNVPAKLAYNPNAYVATNDQRNLVIDLYDIQKTSGKGSSEYNAISVTKTAVYQATLNSPTHIVYYEYRPTAAGMYTVESWMDITAEQYNPYCEAYVGTFAVKYFDKTIDNGGAEGIYTKNFKNEINVSEDMLGNVLTFGVRVDSKDQSKYPVTVTFAIQLNGGFEGNPGTDADMYVMKESKDTYLSAKVDYNKSEYQLVGAYIPSGRENSYIYDESVYKLWKKEDGGDNLYHLYSEEYYPETNGYGPILYAYIKTPPEYVDEAFTSVEYRGNKNLTLTFDDGTRANYKHFIEGYSALATRNESNFNGGSYYCSEYCQCHTGQDTGLACTSDCKKCHYDCRRIKKENIGFEGIQQFANGDGVVAVTEELRLFLQYYSINQRYIADGEGWVETTGVTVDGIQCSLDSDDASQWLFACCYYKSIN